ncbi:hypothetical protein COR50_19300 [Chitinophaga caeni]|uniref:Lipid/polyisoprenoid-binding YceI-like domain-containing protein n=1 Tax=Chitinophaga caeni TaxID=2029983 RepID=A0A291QYX5_9BACT|nr:YceI family protein [Chitinophaga caeni]ATL49147.1 hypothetical protein COR50_19300 [Chitinophaga caeni]
MSAWIIDKAHSEIHFRIKYLTTATVTGAFREFTGKVQTDGMNIENAAIEVKLMIGSISTHHAVRDEHLRSSDFFEASKYPEIHFQSTGFHHRYDDRYNLEGLLTIKRYTEPVSLEVVYGGMERDQQGILKAGFEVAGLINRKQFGLTWNAWTESGPFALGDMIQLEANIELLLVDA